jgi:hypothetical protein
MTIKEELRSRIQDALAQSSDKYDLELEPTERLLLTMPTQAADFDCWFKAIVYYLTTGDLMGAVMKAIQCLMQSGRRTQADMLGCLVQFAIDMIMGVHWQEALLKLIECVFGTPPNPPPPDGDVPEYIPNPVPRCK